MKIIDAAELEKILIAEHKSLVKTFNYAYANTTQLGANLIKAKVMEAKIEVLATIIEALQESVVEGGY